MKRQLLHIMISVCVAGAFQQASATDLLDIYEQSMHCDPTYQAAWSTMLANQEALPQSVANMLPNISATANSTGNYANIVSSTGTVAAVFPTSTTSNSPNGTNNQFSATGEGSTVTRFNSNSYEITLTQPIFNFGNWMTVKAANNTYKQAAATFSAATQDLIIRVAQAYFNVLLAKDNLTNTNAQVAANAQELEQTKQRFEVGIDAITSVNNAQASYDAILAQQIAAQTNLQNSLEALRQLTGQYYADVESLKIELPLITPCPANPDAWVTSAEDKNQTLWAARFQADAARDTVKVDFGGHMPVLNAVGTYARFAGQSFGTTNTNQGSVALELTVPIFAGGAVSSEVRQAEDEYATASSNMEGTRRDVMITAKQQYNSVMSGISKIKADQQAIMSAQSSLDSTQESYKAGTRTIVDVLLAQQQLFQAKTNYSQDEYTYLMDTLLLKQAAGTLCPNDLVAINNWLHGPNRLQTTTKKADDQSDSDDDTTDTTDTTTSQDDTTTQNKASQVITSQPGSEDEDTTAPEKVTPMPMTQSKAPQNTTAQNKTSQKTS